MGSAEASQPACWTDAEDMRNIERGFAGTITKQPRMHPEGEVPLYLHPAVPHAQVASEAMARRFHEAYERLAPQFGYETRPETRRFDPESPNGKLMTAVCAALAAPASGPDQAGGRT